MFRSDSLLTKSKINIFYDAEILFIPCNNSEIITQLDFHNIHHSLFVKRRFLDEFSTGRMLYYLGTSKAIESGVISLYKCMPE